MTHAKRRLQILMIVAISMIVLAAPARGGEWFGFGVGPGGFSLSFGSTDWGVFSSSWHDPGWRIDYHVALAGYGEWVWVDGLGQCWRPWVAVGWRPYTFGRWVWTSFGWTWVAYEPWGYFPHHYGHWALSPHGWVWSPGHVYRAANVVWVGAGGYVGWYASPPPGWSHSHRGWHRGYRHGYARGWDDGYSVGWHDAQHATYTRWGHFGSDDLSRHALGHHDLATNGPAFSVRPGIAAPSRSDLARRGVRTPELEVESRMVRVGDRELTVTRPRGFEAEVRRHAAPTVERALSREARKTVVTRARSRQSSPTAASAGPRAAASSSGSTARRSRTEPSPAPVRRESARSPSSGDDRGARFSTPSTRSTRSRSEAAPPPKASDRRPAPAASVRTRSTHQRSAPAAARPSTTSTRTVREATSSRQVTRRTAQSTAARSPKDSRAAADARSRPTAAKRQRPPSASSRSTGDARSNQRQRSKADARRSSTARSPSDDRASADRRSHRRGNE